MQRLSYILSVFPLIVLGWLASCSFSSPKVEFTVQWQPPSESTFRRAAPGSVTDVSCFFINITGTGLTPNYGPKDYGGRTSECLGTGAIAGPYPLDSLKRGVKLSLAPGANRKIEILGAISAPLGNNCLAYALPKYFGTTAAPQLYELGSTTQNIFVDSRIDVQESYDLNTANDRVAACASTVVGNTTAADIVPTSIVAYALFSTSPQLKLFHYNSTDGTFVFWKDYIVAGTGIVQGLKLSDDFTRLFVPIAATSSGAAIYSVKADRDLSQLSPYAPSIAQNWTSSAVSHDGKNFYSVGTGAIYSAYHVGATTTSLFPTYSATGVHSAVVTPAQVFAIENVGGGRTLMADRAPVTGLLTTSSVAFLPQINNHGAARLFVSLTFDTLLVADPPRITRYAIRTAIPFETDHLDVGALAMEGAMNRSGSRLYVNTATGRGARATSVLTAVRITDDGQLEPDGPAQAVAGVGKVYLDPTEKNVFIRTGVGTLQQISVNLTQGIPIYTSPTNLNTIGSDSVSTLVDLAFVPVYQ